MGGKGSGRSSWKSDELKQKLGTYQPCRAKGGKNEEPSRETGNPQTPRAPSTLGKHGQKLWRRVVGYWQLDPGEQFILERACTAFDELQEVEAALARTGITVIDGKGQEVPHPLTRLRKDCKAELARWWDRLNLNHDIPEE